MPRGPWLAMRAARARLRGGNPVPRAVPERSARGSEQHNPSGIREQCHSAWPQCFTATAKRVLQGTLGSFSPHSAYVKAYLM